MAEGEHQKRAEFLAVLAHELTMVARAATYGPGDQTNGDLLRRFNEVQHRVTGALRHEIGGSSGMPIDAVILMLKDFGADCGLDVEMAGAIHSASRASGFNVSVFH